MLWSGSNRSNKIFQATLHHGASLNVWQCMTPLSLLCGKSDYDSGDVRNKLRVGKRGKATTPTTNQDKLQTILILGTFLDLRRLQALAGGNFLSFLMIPLYHLLTG